MKKQAFNPYLPSWEYIPDGEPYVFDGRVYVYGSHDRYNGQAYCLNDYVCWSAPVDDLGNWSYEGVIYKATDEPENPSGQGCLYAPDVTQGPDGRYYLYYVLNSMHVVSVAVSDTPAGKYEFLGYVRYADGTRLGDREGDEPQFDPAVLTEGDKTYLYTGFCFAWDKSRSGAMATVLDKDMLTIIEDTVFVIPSGFYSEGSGFEGNEFFEAPSIRKIGDTYYLVYSSVQMYELCYATSKNPTKGFTYGGVIISNNDMGIDTYKPANKPMFYGGNNHGSIVQIEDNWYVFYHRHTNGTNYSRQVCAERIDVLEDGTIPQVELTSCGLNDGPLVGNGEYPTYIACNLFCRDENKYTGGMGGNGFWMDSQYPRLMQDGRDGDEEIGYIFNMTDSATAGFKYFQNNETRITKIKVLGYASGIFEVKTEWDGKVLGTIPVGHNSHWNELDCDIPLPNGVHALYITYKGSGFVGLASFTLKGQ
ncbi:MAG TPA: family 43 glycosylhydrolase [Clostridia bacterium]|nr:family 43 glycosylhydrolase [Clostridia bacterium]